MSLFPLNNQDIEKLADALLRQPCVAVDTESDSMYHYREKVCLIQISSPGTGTVILDPLSGTDLTPLGRVMADPDITKVLHGADFDITSLKRDFCWTFAGLFDTGCAARFLGWEGVGLAAVIKRELGITIEKGPQTADWSQRPLPESLVRYAAGDVDHLVEIYTRMVDHLNKARRLEWVIEESAAIADIGPASKVPAPADFHKAKGAQELDPRGLTVLKHLFETRERICAQVDRPRFKVVPDAVLVELAWKRPTSKTEFEKYRWIPSNLSRKPAPWLDAIAAGMSAELETHPVRKRGPAPDPAIGARIERLRHFREELAVGLGLEPGLVLPQRLINALAAASPVSMDDLAAVEGIRRWRCETFGQDLLSAVSGVRRG